MTPRIWLCAVLTAVVSASAASVVAQSNDVTIVMKSGERQPATNVTYMDRRDLVARTSFQDEPRIPVSDVAYIDFGGTADVSIGLSGPQEALMLRDGTILKGQVLQINHTDAENHATPYLVSFMTSAGETRRVAAPELARIYFGESAVTASSTTAAAGGRVVTIDARQAWTSTTLTVRKGERVRFAATGQIRLSNNAENDLASPDGHLQARLDQGSPLVSVPVGALIGRVNNGRPFAIGSNAEVTMPAAGGLFLGINDSNMADNQGSFGVDVFAGVRAR